MDLFENVKVEKNANVYFDGRVTSRNIFFTDGTKKTLGVMLPGSYEFGTEKKEIMEIQSGILKVLLPEETEWMDIKGGTSFEVPENSKFTFRNSSKRESLLFFISQFIFKFKNLSSLKLDFAG